MPEVLQGYTLGNPRVKQGLPSKPRKEGIGNNAVLGKGLGKLVYRSVGLWLLVAYCLYLSNQPLFGNGFLIGMG